MSVTKYVISKNHDSYTVIPTKVIQGLKNYEAVGLYSYMLSLPPNWEFYSNHLADQGGIGRDKTRKLLKILCASGLISIAQTKDEKGRFSHYQIDVLNGNSFKNSEVQEVAQPVTDLPSTDNQLLENSTYKRNKKKEIINKENIVKRYSATSVAREPSTPSSSFNRFWSLYPRKKDRIRAWEVWEKNGLEEIVDSIIDDVVHRKTYDYQWKEPTFVPYAKNYLSGKQWEDDIEKDTQRKSSTKTSAFSEHFFSKPDKELFDEHGNIVDFG